MALTKKDLLEAIEDMPMDAEIYLSTGYRDSNIENCSIKEINGKDAFLLHPYPIVYAC